MNMNFNHFVCHTCTMGEKAVMEANSNYWVFLNLFGCLFIVC